MMIQPMTQIQPERIYEPVRRDEAFAHRNRKHHEKETHDLYKGAAVEVSRRNRRGQEDGTLTHFLRPILSASQLFTIAPANDPALLLQSAYRTKLIR